MAGGVRGLKMGSKLGTAWPTIGILSALTKPLSSLLPKSDLGSADMIGFSLGMCPVGLNSSNVPIAVHNGTILQTVTSTRISRQLQGTLHPEAPLDFVKVHQPSMERPETWIALPIKKNPIRVEKVNYGKSITSLYTTNKLFGCA